MAPSARATPHTTAQSSMHAQRLPRSTVLDILQYIPHVPSLCCAAAHPHLRYARETIAGTRAEGTPRRRGDLFVCWDATTGREYHSFSGSAEELAADVSDMTWWLTRPFTPAGEPMIMEVHVKHAAAATSATSAMDTDACSGSPLDRLLRVFAQPPFQRADAGVSCVRSLILADSGLEATAATVGLVGQLTHLEKLESFTPALTLPLPAIPSVYVLRLRNTKALTSLTPLLPLSGLTRLSLCRCGALRSLAGLATLTQLTELSVANCRVLDVSGTFAACRRLTSVSMRWCCEVLNVGALATLPHLRDLDCSYSGLRGAEGLAQCQQLRRLCLRGCKTAHELFPTADQLAAPTTAWEAASAAATPDVSITAMSIMSSLYEGESRWATVGAPTQVTRLLAALPRPGATAVFLTTATPVVCTLLAHLEELDAGESSLSSVSGLPHCAPELRHLTVRDCQQLHSLSALGQLPTLTSVDASFSGVDELDGLSESVSLQYLNLKNCARLRSVAPLACVSSLREVDVSVASQNCIICIDDVQEATGEDGGGSDYCGGGCLPDRAGRCVAAVQRKRRSELIRLSGLTGPAAISGTHDMCIDTAVTPRSSYGMLQHRVQRDAAQALLSQPLGKLRVREGRPNAFAA